MSPCIRFILFFMGLQFTVWQSYKLTLEFFVQCKGETTICNNKVRQLLKFKKMCSQLFTKIIWLFYIVPIQQGYCIKYCRERKKLFLKWLSNTGKENDEAESGHQIQKRENDLAKWINCSLPVCRTFLKVFYAHNVRILNQYSVKIFYWMFFFYIHSNRDLCICCICDPDT